MDFVILLDAGRRYAPVLFYQTSLGLAPGIHVFVRSRGIWLHRVATVAAGQIHITFAPVNDARLIAGLNDLWKRSKTKRPARPADDAEFLQMLLTLDVWRGAVLRQTQERPESLSVRAKSNTDNTPDIEKSFEYLDSVLNGGKADLEFIKYLLDHGRQIHHALHLVANGDPTGLTSLLFIVFAAMGHTFVADHDMKSIAEDVLKEASPRPVRVTIEICDIVETTYDVRTLLRDDAVRWLELEQKAPALSVSPVQELNISDDFDLSL